MRHVVEKVMALVASPVVSFRHEHLFGSYRDKLESTRTLDLVDEPKIDPEIQTDLVDMEVDTTTAMHDWSDEHANSPESKKHTLQQQQKQDLYSKEYELIQLLDKKLSVPAPFDYTVEDIINTAGDWLLDDLQLDSMDRTNALFKEGFLLELILHDKRSGKIATLHDRLQQIRLRGENSDEVDRLIAQTYHIAKSPWKDDFYIECSKPKKRGRISDADRKKTPHIIDNLRSDYISSQKVSNIFNESLSPANGADTDVTDPANFTDKYKVFLRVLEIVHDNIPSKENYGAYINNTVKLIQNADTKWPLAKLFGAILNMECLLGITLIENIQFDANEQTYYCSYTGDKISVGDDVHHIRVLLNDADRYRRWRILKTIPEREFESPDFTKSVRAFFIKKTVVAPMGLFYTPFDESYRAYHSDYFEPEKKKMKYEVATSVARVTVSRESKIWHKMDSMRELIFLHNLGNKVVSGKTFDDEMARVHHLLEAVRDSSDAAKQTQECLFNMVEPYCTEKQQQGVFTKRFITILLQFVGCFFTIHAKEALGIDDVKNCDCSGNKIPLMYLLEMLRQLQSHPTSSALENKFVEIEQRCDGDISQFPEYKANGFLFLSLFNYLFPSQLDEKTKQELQALFG